MFPNSSLWMMIETHKLLRHIAPIMQNHIETQRSMTWELEVCRTNCRVQGFHIIRMTTGYWV